MNDEIEVPVGSNQGSPLIEAFAEVMHGKEIRVVLSELSDLTARILFYTATTIGQDPVVITNEYNEHVASIVSSILQVQLTGHSAPNALQ